MRRAAPEINILCELLSHVGCTYYTAVQFDHIGIALIRAGYLRKKPQDEDITDTEEDAESNRQLERFK